jgi:hypothetical protein
MKSLAVSYRYTVGVFDEVCLFLCRLFPFRVLIFGSWLVVIRWHRGGGFGLEAVKRSFLLSSDAFLVRVWRCSALVNIEGCAC